MKKLICILLVFILPQIIFANQRYHFSNLSVQNGLSQLHVTCIYQDRLGYMWFGTRNGLNKFNGNNFETFWNHAETNAVSATIPSPASPKMRKATSGSERKTDWTNSINAETGSNGITSTLKLMPPTIKSYPSSPIRKARCGWGPSSA